MSNTILLIFEGAKTEPQIFNNINQIFFKNIERPILTAIYETEIYQLWEKVKDDEFLDLVEVLRLRNEKNKKELSGITRNDVSEIYLFFDFEKQKVLENTDWDKDFIKMLSHFDNETENGKLYISYPMVEALKDLKRDPKECFDACFVYLGEFDNYKNMVSKKDFIHINKYSKEDWFYIIIINIMKANCLVNNIDNITSYSDFLSLNQITIFQNQLIKFIKKSNKIIVLSSFPFFIVDYFGEKLFKEIITNPISKSCMFICLKSN